MSIATTVRKKEFITYYEACQFASLQDGALYLGISVSWLRNALLPNSYATPSRCLLHLARAYAKTGYHKHFTP